MSDKKAKLAAADKKVKLVRDSFSMPKNEYAAIDALKARALGMQLVAKKSELLRAGLLALSAMDDASLRTMLSAVPTLKTGRPKKAEAAAPAATKAAPAKAPAKTPATASAPAAAPALPARTRARRAPAATKAPAPAAQPVAKATSTRAPARKPAAKAAGKAAAKTTTA